MEYISIIGKLFLNNNVKVKDLKLVNDELRKFESSEFSLDFNANSLSIKAETQGDSETISKLFDVFRKIKSQDSLVILNKDMGRWTSTLTLIALSPLPTSLPA